LYIINAHSRTSSRSRMPILYARYLDVAQITYPVRYDLFSSQSIYIVYNCDIT